MKIKQFLKITEERIDFVQSTDMLFVLVIFGSIKGDV